MALQQEQKITVRSDVLPNLIADIANGSYRIPQFQREFVWNKPKIIELFDSIYQEFPIGSFFLWKAGREHNGLFRHTVNFDVPPVQADDNVSFILDGQQRSTSLYVTLNGLTVDGEDYGRVCFDLEEEKFTNRIPDNHRHVSVSDIWGPQSMSLSRKIAEQYVAAYGRCWQTLRTYPLSLVEVRDKDLAAVSKIFQRINQSGKRLDRFDLIAAMTFTPDFDLRQRFKKDVAAPLKEKRFGVVSETILTQLMALAEFGAATERNEHNLTAAAIKKHWPGAVDAVLLSADTLRKGMGVVNYKYLPYDAVLTLLAYYFLKSGNRSLPADHTEWVRRWFWRSAFGARYGGAAATKIGQDRELLDRLAAGEMPALDQQVQLTAASLARVRMKQSGSAVRNAFLCLLATLHPRHLANNSPLDLVNGSISDFTKKEKHHVFPVAFLTKHGPAGADIHSLPNFCFLPADLNKRISGRKPSDYFAELRAANPQFSEAAATHLLPMGPESGIEDDDYPVFLHARGEMILKEVGRLCGEITTPRENQRQLAIRDLENRLRDRIDVALLAKAGESYWKQCVPQNVREEAQKRIEEALKKHPDLRRDEFRSNRKKLDYCNVMDYLTIMGNGGNWPLFEPTFRKRDELQKYMSGLNEYRNAVMHSREMTELVKMNGEAALLWFATVLKENGDEGGEPPQEDAATSGE